jgi:squalene cyclase
MIRDCTKSLEHVLSLSLEYILSLQRHDGCWTDWNLPPGESSIWTTAFVGYKLRNLPTNLKARALVSVRLASEWLYGRMFPDSGWGYNEEVGSDADSTATAILFLSSDGRILPENCYSCLRQFQCPDGGFATYRGNGGLDSWTVPHTDVTPTAILALLTEYERETEAVERGIGFVLKQRTTAGVWESFWWTSFLYGTEASMDLLSTVGREFDRHQAREVLLNSQPKNAFERALLLLCLIHLSKHSMEQEMQVLISQLVQDQECNGSWRNDAMLRIPRHDCFEPWKQGDSDPAFSDTKRLFTTSTALDALSMAYAVLTGRCVDS